MLRDFIRASLGFINKYMAKGLPDKTSSGCFEDSYILFQVKKLFFGRLLRSEFQSICRGKAPINSGKFPILEISKKNLEFLIFFLTIEQA